MVDSGVFGDTRSPWVDDSKRHRSWFFTLPESMLGGRMGEAAAVLEAGLRDDPGVEEFAFQSEVGAGGLPHLQGCLLFSEAKFFSRVRKMMRTVVGEPGYLAPCGSWAASVRYCTKDSTRDEGPWLSREDLVSSLAAERPGRGARTDLHALQGKLDSGLTPEQILLEDPAALASAGTRSWLNALWTARERKRLSTVVRPVQVGWVWGASRSGKSYWSLEESERLGGGVFIDCSSPSAWDSYHGEKTIVLDDFRASDLSITGLKRILDGMPLSVHRRYQDYWAAWERVIITSNDSPETAFRWYGKAGATSADITALKRRVSWVARKDRRDDAVTPRWVAD